MAREFNKPTDWREEIEKTIKSADEPEVEEVEEPEVEEKAEKPEKDRDETGKFKAKEEEEKAETVEQETEKPAEIIDPPAHFTAEEKKYFESLPSEQQKWIASSVKRMSSTVDKRMQEYSTYQRRAQAYDEALTPYRQQLAMQGVDEVAAIKQLFSTYDQLQRDPANTIRWLAQSYGVDLSQSQDVPQDPQFVALQNQLGELRQGYSTIQSTLQNERQNQMLNVVNQFAEEKDAQGNTKHPHFKAVIEDMMKIIQAGIVENTDLKSAYTIALAKHPELTQVSIPTTAPKIDQKIDHIKEAAEKAARAKKAAAGVKSGAGSPKTEVAKSQRQEIEDLVSAAMK